MPSLLPVGDGLLVAVKRYDAITTVAGNVGPVEG